jgi:hypothetical protein
MQYNESLLIVGNVWLFTNRRYDLWLSIITLFLILVFEASRAPFELFNIHHVLTNWKVGIFPIQVGNLTGSLCSGRHFTL